MKISRLSFEIEELSNAIKAKIVNKCGTRDYWENWASDIAKIATTHTSLELSQLFQNQNQMKEKNFFIIFKEIQDD